MVSLDGAQASSPDLVGAKAATLGRLRAAGLPVLDGAVLLPDEPVDDAQLAAELARLGGDRFAVRSSSSLEDLAGLTGAGVFESVIGARGVAGVQAAIARVRASASGPGARAYLEARGVRGAVRMAVLIQPEVRAERLGVARSEETQFLVEERRAGEPEWGDVQARELGRDDPGALASGLRAIEALLGQPVDVEFARAGEAVTFLQARPFAQPASSPESDQPFRVPGSWRLDAEHNPDPLSAAQAGLVALVEAEGVGREQRVIGGYLYVARGSARATQPIPLGELRRRFADEVAPECEARLRAVEDQGALEPALEVFRHVYRRYVGEVSPTLQRAREQLDQLLRINLGEGLAAHGALLAGLGGATLERDQLLWELGRAAPGGDDRDERLRAYLERFGALAPAWDVSVPPDDEAPERVLSAAALLFESGDAPIERHARALAGSEAAAHATLELLDRMSRRAFKALLPLVREVLPVAEDDDLLFFRAQRAVRRALTGIGSKLALGDGVFELSIDTLRAGAREHAAELASNRAARLAAGRRVPPPSIDDGRPRRVAPAPRDVLRGHPTAGLARGRAVVVRSLSAVPVQLPPDAVLVVPAILPSLTYLLPAVRALVTDHGGATSHGATLAREYGIPAVLGTGRATALTDGTPLYVDGAAGRVYVL